MLMQWRRKKLTHKVKYTECTIAILLHFPFTCKSRNPPPTAVAAIFPTLWKRYPAHLKAKEKSKVRIYIYIYICLCRLQVTTKHPWQNTNDKRLSCFKPNESRHARHHMMCERPWGCSHFALHNSLAQRTSQWLHPSWSEWPQSTSRLSGQNCSQTLGSTTDDAWHNLWCPQLHTTHPQLQHLDLDLDLDLKINKCHKHIYWNRKVII